MFFPQTTATCHTLPNGLTLIFDKRCDHPVISTQLWVETGSIHEDQLMGSGLSHFLEHMVFKGTQSFDGINLAAIVQAAGGHWNAYTTFDRTVYYIDGPSHGLNVFLEVLVEMVFRPTLPENDFAMEKDVIRREIDIGLDDPSDAAARLIFESAYRNDPRRLPVIGQRTLFDRVSHADLVSYHRKRYTTNRSFFIISGDFDEAQAIEKITALTRDLEPGYEVEPYRVSDPAQCSLRTAEATFAIPTSRVTLAWKIPPLGDPDIPVFEVLAAMLGRGKSSHLYTELREKKELALEISSWSWTANIGEGLFAISAECEPENRKQLIAAILEEVRRYESLPCEKSLSRAQRQIAVSQYHSLTTASGRAADLASNWHEARDLNFTRHFLESVMSVSTADIARCLQSLTDSKLTITQLNPLRESTTARTEDPAAQQNNCLTKTLTNGLQVALFADPRIPLVSVQLAVRCGLPAEEIERAGLGTLLSATITQGTGKRTALEIASTLDELGASLHASAGNNSILLSGSCLSPDLPVLLEIFSDVLLHPEFPEDVISREKSSLISSIRESLEDPLSSAFLTMRGLLFDHTGYGLPSSGTVESIERISRADLLAHHGAYFQARKMTLAIAGNFDPDQIATMLENDLSGHVSGAVFATRATATCQGLIETKYLDKKQAVLAIGFPGLSALDPRRYAAAMLLEYCADMAGPLFTRIREELGLAYQVGATQFYGHDAGMIAFYLSTSPEQLELAHRELLAEIGKIAANGIAADQFESVRATVLSALVLQQQSPGSIARQAVVDMIFGLPATHHREVHEHILKLVPEDVRSLAAALFSDRAPVTVIVTQGP